MTPKKRCIDDDGEASELNADFLRQAKRREHIPDLVAILQHHGKPGRRALPPGSRKQRGTLHLDPDALHRVKAEGRGWQTRTNAALRRALGL